MKKTTCIILLIFLMLPFFSQAEVGVDGDINKKEPEKLTAENPLDDSEIERYINSADKITQIVEIGG